MIPFLRRYSTYANLIAGITAAVIAFVPALNLGSQPQAYIMLACNIIIALCQAAKQKPKA